MVGWERCEVWEVYGQCRRFMQAWRDGGPHRERELGGFGMVIMGWM